MSETRFGDFKIDMAGMRSILKSAPVEAELEKQAGRIANACNAACYADRGREGHIESKKEPFRAWTKQGGYTAYGYVGPRNVEGVRFQSRPKIIDSLNH